MTATARRYAIVGALGLALALLPLVATDFFVDATLTRALILGLAASSLIFLHAYGGMTSLAQTLMFGVAAFMVGNFSVSEAGSKGLKLGLDPWLSVLLALLVTVVVALLFGAVASRTTEIYYLMLTLVYAVIGFNFFGQVTTFSGFGGITGIDPPELFRLTTEAGQQADGRRIYYLILVLSLVAYLALKGLSRTPFGIALQGVRDDPVRMASLGFNVPAIRTIAFTLCGVVAGVAGVVFAWWNGAIAPQTIGLAPTIDLLIIAVIGGISYLEGAWLGSIVFVMAGTYLRNLPLIDQIGLTEERFNTVVGLLVLLIMVASPEGLTGIAQRIRGQRPARPDDFSAAGSPEPTQTEQADA